MYHIFLYISIVIIKGEPKRVLACSIWYRGLLVCLFGCTAFSLKLEAKVTYAAGEKLVSTLYETSVNKKNFIKYASIRMFLIHEVKLRSLKQRLSLDLYLFP